MNKLYEATKGYKTLAGFIFAFVIGGLAYTKVIDADTAKQLELVAGSLIAFGLGDKLGRKMS